MKNIIIYCISIFAFGACADDMSKTIEPTYTTPSSVYRHNIFETPHEFKSLDTGEGQLITLDEQTVFEGIAPIGFQAQGKDYIMATQSDLSLGAYLALYAQNEMGHYELVDQLAPIGRSHRWLALAFVHDLDGNGYPEVAYVETPHLGRVAKLYEVVDDQFKFRGEFSGVTNHHIGSDEILGGLVVKNDQVSWRLVEQSTNEWIELVWDGKNLSKNP